MRFATINPAISAVGSWQCGFRDLNSQNKRAMLQITANSPFALKVNATLKFDFDTNVGTGWFDVTDRVRTLPDSQPGWVLVGSVYQVRDKGNEFGLPLTKPGLYVFDPDFFPAAFSFQVTSITSGDVMQIDFGL